jgi:protease-4
MSDEKNFQHQAMENLLFASLVEQRRKRRWGIFFKLLGFGYLLVILALLLVNPSPGQNQGDKTKPHVALIDITGVIDEKAMANAEDVIKSLNQAFKAKYVEGIILKINSPGGSPVQAAYIYDEILRLRAQNKKLKVYTVCSDICASAAYYVASASDKIYANPLSLIGSIGVIMEGFGFTETMRKVGVERRLFTSGDRKGFLDPFSPIKPEDATYAKHMLELVHQQFIRDVQKGRGKRLKSSPELFSGLIWTGLQSLPLGLIDGFGSVGSVARDIFKNDNVVDYTYYPGYFESLTNQLRTVFHQEINGEILRQVQAAYPYMKRVA